MAASMFVIAGTVLLMIGVIGFARQRVLALHTFRVKNAFDADVWRDESDQWVKSVHTGVGARVMSAFYILGGVCLIGAAMFQSIPIGIFAALGIVLIGHYFVAATYS